MQVDPLISVLPDQPVIQGVGLLRISCHSCCSHDDVLTEPIRIQIRD
jgi:hypothetical protein